MGKFYDLNGNRISMAKWVKLFEGDQSDRIIAKTTLRDGSTVSTVFLGINHNYGEGPPLLFETMVFSSKDSEGLDTRRYSTKEEAQAGHDEMVLAWADGDPEALAFSAPHPDPEAAGITVVETED